VRLALIVVLSALSVSVSASANPITTPPKKGAHYLARHKRLASVVTGANALGLMLGKAYLAGVTSKTTSTTPPMRPRPK
jgi:hypothetical protein